MKTLIATLLLSPLAYTMVHANAAANPPPAESCPPHVRSDSIYFKHIEGKGVGYHQGYSTLGAFFTPYATFSHVLPFLDLRGHIFNRTWKFAANAGAGVKWLADAPFVAALAAYYDYRQTHRSHYNQAGLSFELLANRWEFRANGYLPVGRKRAVRKHSKVASYNFESFSGHSMFYSTTYDVRKNVEFAMKGGDAEIGVHLMKPQENYTVYLGGGPYYFHSPSGLKRHALGGQVRVEARVSPYLTLQISDSWDNLFHNRFQGEISLNIPLGGRIKKKKNPSKMSCSDVLAIEARMMQPMHRNEIIVADKRKLHYTKTVDPVAQSIFGGPLNFVFANASAPSGGNGTFENPYNDIFVATQNTSANDVLYITGDFTPTAGPVTLLQNQSLLGSGIAQSVPIQVSPRAMGTVVIPPMSANLPSITQGFVSNLVFVNGDNVVISGIQFLTTVNGIFTITNAIQNTNNFDPITNLTVQNSNLSVLGAGSYGIYLRAVSGEILIQNNTINGNPGQLNGQNGIYIEQFGPNGNPGSYTANANIINNSLQFWNSDGGLNSPILLQTNLNTGQGTVNGASVLNVLLKDNNCQNNIFSPAAGHFLFAGGESTINATLINNISQLNLYGMVFQAQDAATINITATGNNCSSNLNQGFYISATGSSRANITLNNNTIENNQAQGIFVTPNLAFGSTQAQTAVSLTANFNNNFIKSNTNSGINFTAQSGTVSSILTFENNDLLGNGTDNGFSFYVANGVASGSSSSTLQIFMDGNINDNFGYGLANFNTSPSTFNIVQGGKNVGVITLIESTSPQTGPYNIIP